MTRPFPVFAVALALAACAPEQQGEFDNERRDRAAPPANATESIANAQETLTRETPSRPSAAGDVLTLEGLGDLRISRPVPAGSGWAERGGQASDTCRTVSSPDFPGVYAIVEGGTVRRITLGQRSAGTLAGGIGIGSTEAEVLARFPGLRAEPHEYVAAPARYLTSPDAANGEPAWRFEIGEDGRVGLIHVGTMPVLGYVEGCA